MPYLKPEERKAIDEGHPPMVAGQLNYAISCLARDYMDRHNDTYATRNDVMGAMTGALNEYIRCVVNPYEIRKAMENGTLYGNPPRP